MYPPPHDPAALAYQQWLQQQQPAPQYAPQPTAAFPFTFPPGAQQLQLAPVAPPAPYLPPAPAFQPSPFLSPTPRRARQPRQQSQPEPDGNELVSLSIVVLLSLLIGAALGAVGEHHRLSSAVEAGVIQ